MADKEKDGLNDLIDLHKTLKEALKEEYDILDKSVPVIKVLHSIQDKIVKETRKENKSKGDTVKLTENLENLQIKILKLIKTQHEFGINNESEILALTIEAKKEADKIYKIKQKTALQEYQAAMALQILNKIGFEKTLNFSKELSEAFSKNPILGLGKLLLHSLEVFDKIDTAAAKFRQEMGITREFTGLIDNNARTISFNLAHVGVNAEKAYEAVLGLSKSLFSSMSATKSMVSDISLISAQLGVSAETSSEFMKNVGIIFRDIAGARSNMTYFTAKLTEAAGVPLKDIMEDISNATKNSYQFISRTGLSLIKASVEAKRMGTSLAEAVKSSAALLNFTQNVKEEMEASVLVGKPINLQKARELAYHRDIRGLNKEILKIMKDVNFETLDPFQQDSVAKAFGKTAGELANMAQAERERLGWERSTDPIIKKQLAAYKEMMDATETTAKQLGESARHQLTIKANQAAIASITQSWNAILNRIGEGILPVIDTILKTIARGIGIINNFISKTNEFFAQFGETAGWASKMVMGLAVAVSLLVGTKGLGRLAGLVTGGLGKGIGNLFGGIAGGVSKFGNVSVIKGAIGMALVGASLIPFAIAMKMMEGINWKTVGIMAVSMLILVAATAALGAIMMSGVGAVALLLGAAALVILGVAMIPFAAAAWITSKALQNLSEVKWVDIAKGIFMIGIQTPLILGIGFAMAAAAPGVALFSLALIPLSMVANKAGMGMVSLGGGLKTVVESFAQLQSLSFINTIIQIKNLSTAVKELSVAVGSMPDIKVEKLQSLLSTSMPVVGVEGKKDETSSTLLAIKEAIEGLRNDMKSGTLTSNVYIDSQKLDSLMGRRLAYTGQLI